MSLSDEEITRQLAEMVMGWELQAKYGWYGTAEERFAHWLGEEEHAKKWRPLESIADAWMVRDRLATGGDFSLFCASGIEHAVYTPQAACVRLPQTNAQRLPPLPGSALATTAPRAICLCALRAVGVEPEP
ncbi:MAG TPA: hypothetical protein VIE43_06475 [Thermoanaerobaculia bacterium]|jgi:hypothetical protein|nr:hypothetical protein [Thermoanaerobaculia bacterium]